MTTVNDRDTVVQFLFTVAMYCCIQFGKFNLGLMVCTTLTVTSWSKNYLTLMLWSQFLFCCSCMNLESYLDPTATLRLLTH